MDILLFENLNEKGQVMKFTRVYIVIAVSLSICLLMAGCANYYQVKDVSTNKIYYTTKAIEIQDNNELHKSRYCSNMRHSIKRCFVYIEIEIGYSPSANLCPFVLIRQLVPGPREKHNAPTS